MHLALNLIGCRLLEAWAGKALLPGLRMWPLAGLFLVACQAQSLHSSWAGGWRPLSFLPPQLRCCHLPHHGEQAMKAEGASKTEASCNQSRKWHPITSGLPLHEKPVTGDPTLRKGGHAGAGSSGDGSHQDAFGEAAQHRKLAEHTRPVTSRHLQGRLRGTVLQGPDARRTCAALKPSRVILWTKRILELVLFHSSVTRQLGQNGGFSSVDRVEMSDGLCQDGRRRAPRGTPCAEPPRPRPQPYCCVSSLWPAFLHPVAATPPCLKLHVLGLGRTW